MTDYGDSYAVKGAVRIAYRLIMDGIIQPISQSTPSDPGTSLRLNMYYKSPYIVFQYNDAGTIRYKYLDLSGTGVTWVHSTTAP